MTCQWQDPKHLGTHCGKPAVCRWRYWGGAALAVCGAHDAEMVARLAIPHCAAHPPPKRCPPADVDDMRKNIVREAL